MVFCRIQPRSCFVSGSYCLVRLEPFCGIFPPVSRLSFKRQFFKSCRARFPKICLERHRFLSDALRFGGGLPTSFATFSAAPFGSSNLEKRRPAAWLFSTSLIIACCHVLAAGRARPNAQPKAGHFAATVAHVRRTDSAQASGVGAAL